MKILVVIIKTLAIGLVIYLTFLSYMENLDLLMGIFNNGSDYLVVVPALMIFLPVVLVLCILVI